MVKIAAIPMLDVAEFPLRLPIPDNINSGGYLVPTPEGSVYIYSPIDLLVAGLEAAYLGIEVTSLVEFFDKYKHPISCHDVYITLHDGDNFITYSIARIKLLHVYDKIMIKNAPLTFKWSV